MAINVNAQQEAVALWKYLESRKLTPSVRKVATMMRAGGMPIDDKLARTCLAPFAAAAPHPRAFRQIFTASAPHEHRTEDAQTPHDHREHTAPAGGDKVSLVSKPIPTGASAEPTPLSLLDSVSVAETTTSEKPVKKARRVPSAADLEAYRLLDGLWSRISPHLNPGAYTAAIWKRNHKRIALEMLEGGVPVEDWFDFWDVCAEAGKPYRVLKNFQAGFANRRGQRTEPIEQNESDRLPSASELQTPEEKERLRREIDAERPAWFTPQMAEA